MTGRVYRSAVGEALVPQVTTTGSPPTSLSTAASCSSALSCLHIILVSSAKFTYVLFSPVFSNVTFQSEYHLNQAYILYFVINHYTHTRTIRFFSQKQ